MGMSRKEKRGALIVVAILLVLGILYAMTVVRPKNATGDFENNPFVQRRVQNVQ